MWIPNKGEFNNFTTMKSSLNPNPQLYPIVKTIITNPLGDNKNVTIVTL